MTDLIYHYEAIEAHLQAIGHLSRSPIPVIGKKPEDVSGEISLWWKDRKIHAEEFNSRSERLQIILKWRMDYNVWVKKGYYLKIVLREEECQE